MRSRSSALSHVLGSHPLIVGHGELRQPYHHRHDVLRARLQLKQALRHKYFHDKLLHNYTSVRNEILLNPDNKVVFLLREPLASLKSFVRLYRHEESDSDKTDRQIQQDYRRYFLSRLPTLVDAAKGLGERAFYVDSDDLLTRTDEVLQDLTRFIDLPSPLKKEFEIFPETGSFGHGDTTGGLAAARLQPIEHSQPCEIDAEIGAEMIEAYHQARSLIRKSTGIPTD